MKCLLIPLLLILPGSSYGVKEDPAAQMRESLSHVHSLICDFQQEREVSVLMEKGISRGTLSYIRDRALLWQYSMPDRSGFLLRGNEISILDARGQPVPDPGAGGLFRHIGNIILSGLSGDILEETEAFTPRFVTSEDYIHVTLIPRQRDLKRLFKDLELFFRKEDHMIQTVVINEVSGDKTNVRMGNIRVNVPIDEKKLDAYVSP